MTSQDNSNRNIKQQFNETKSKWEITMDIMMIIGKYFKRNNDYVNMMKVAKRYRDLVLMYHFNPIRECELFENMETQYMYNENDIRKEGMHQYVYLYQVDYEVFKNRKENEIFKRVEINSKEIDWKTRKYPLPIENGNCIIPEGVTSIGFDCFNGCTSLTNIQLPSSLVSIDHNAFSDTNITTITIPEGVTSIGNNCFDGCRSLTSVQLPSSLISIGKYAFITQYGYKVPLKQVEVPKNCKIGKCSFENSCEVVLK